MSHNQSLSKEEGKGYRVTHYLLGCRGTIGSRFRFVVAGIQQHMVRLEVVE